MGGHENEGEVLLWEDRDGEEVRCDCGGVGDLAYVVQYQAHPVMRVEWNLDLDLAQVHGEVVQEVGAHTDLGALHLQEKDASLHAEVDPLMT